jgi:hypothetical protein
MVDRWRAGVEGGEREVVALLGILHAQCEIEMFELGQTFSRNLLGATSKSRAAPHGPASKFSLRRKDPYIGLLIVRHLLQWYRHLTIYSLTFVVRPSEISLCTMASFSVGIIGMGDMGKMYTRRLSEAGYQ